MTERRVAPRRGPVRFHPDRRRLKPVARPALPILLGLPLAAFVLAALLPEPAATATALCAALADLCIAAVAVCDLFLGASLPPPLLAADGEMALSLGQESTMGFSLANAGKRDIAVQVALNRPDEWSLFKGPGRLSVPAGGSVEASFSFRPLRRGRVEFPSFTCRMASPLGLFWMQRELPAGFTVTVLPDLRGLKEHLQAARMVSGDIAGAHLSRTRGGGAELDYLREYRTGDEYRRIDWKASARLGKPVTKVLRTETARHVLIALDAGRQMTAEEDGLSSFDRATGALLLLASVAFEMGDSVSIVVFSDRIIGDIGLVRGRESLSALAGFLSGIEPDYSEPNYELLNGHILSRLKRRSLVAIISDLSEAGGFHSPSFGALGRRHQLLLALLRDPVLGAWAESAPRPGEEKGIACGRSQARAMLMDRERSVALLKAGGLPVLDIAPSALSGRLVESYLDLKARSAF